MSMRTGYGWVGTVGDYLSLTEPVLLQQLVEHHHGLWGASPSASQRKAWSEEHKVMRQALQACVAVLPDAAPAWGVVFEYELPLEGGRRPDVVVLAGAALVVLEFKSSALPTPADVDQVTAYVRDLVDYQEASHQMTPHAILVMTGAAPGLAHVYRDEVVIIAPEALDRYLFNAADGAQVDVVEWVRAPYHPLPTLVEAARRIFRNEPLPHVKRALAAGIPETVELLGRLVEQAAGDGGRFLAFVTGVPGSGKTLVGLRLVYERSSELGRATFLSGNGPLVAVLQDALRSRVFVKDLHAFIRTYGINQSTKAPPEHVLVFDEAQRAWDRAYHRAKRQVDASEPDLLVRIGERVAGWSALVGLVGEGQEIHSGEEAGIVQWRQAASAPNATEDWLVHCPPKLADTFAGLPAMTHERLDLTVSLRSRRAERLHDWVQHLVNGSIPVAARQAQRMWAQAYPMYVTRDLDDARTYVRLRFAGEDDKRFGLLASSHAKNLSRYGVDNGFMDTSRMNIAKWYNAPPDDPASSCALSQPVTEFGCQGLELDLPILCWGDDAQWRSGGWDLRPVRRRYPEEDARQLLVNTYRVLLTRGRDALVVWLPPAAVLDETENILIAAGLKPIPEPADLVGDVSA
jgi:hypothetical protein